MKKLMFFMMLALALTVNAAPREMRSAVPSQIPSVEVTLNGKTTNVTITEASVVELDDNHVQCTVFGTGDSKASVKVPVSFDFVLDVALKAANYAKQYGFISNETYNACVKQYKALKAK